MKKITKKTIISNLIMITLTVLGIGLASSIFGSNNTLVWVAMQVSLTMYTKMNIGIDKKQAPIIIILLFLLIGISNRLAMLNPFLGAVINFITIFIIMYIPSRKVEQKPYMPFILCYIFAQSNPATGNDLKTRFISLLLGGILVAITYYISHRKSEEEKIHIKNIFKNIDITSNRFILSFKMAIGVTLAMFIGDIIGLQKTMWIALSVMSITQIDFKQTQERFKYRIISTIIGAIAFVILFKYLIPEHYTVIASLILSYIYTFVEAYNIQIIFVTVNSLSSAMLLFDSVTAVWLRIILVITGCVIGYTINKLNFEKIFKKDKKSNKQNKKVLN